MSNPPFLTFASILSVDTEDLAYACSLSHAQCDALSMRLQAVITRCTAERAGKEVCLRRLWPFFKALSENESASQIAWASHPGRPPFTQRTLMAPIRAKSRKDQAIKSMYTILSKINTFEEDIHDLFHTVLPEISDLDSKKDGLEGVCMEWRHWVTMLASFKLIAQIHPLYQRVYMYEGPIP